jgi:hypothetical protein
VHLGIGASPGGGMGMGRLVSSLLKSLAEPNEDAENDENEEDCHMMNSDVS